MTTEETWLHILLSHIRKGDPAASSDPMPCRRQVEMFVSGLLLERMAMRVSDTQTGEVLRSISEGLLRS